jgi:hypothetical protein
MAVFAAYCSGGCCTGLQPAIPSTLRRGSVLSISKIVMQVEVLLFILLFLSVNRFELSGSSADLSKVISPGGVLPYKEGYDVGAYKKQDLGTT